ncbi:MAG: Ig-like domain repeat protein [Methanobrevibacter sp.]|uniref:Ig-like domain-containing protein n=1 Tax=Methanobrevibacter sp. TaxID=66852 RepID=UPI0025D3EFB1|nr:Ig-like domain-containing protein [Methanobrevibacter sp.]MBQ6098317.1 Ig-like domain repeat protein [Methanobrevibacter sp.]
MRVLKIAIFMLILIMSVGAVCAADVSSDDLMGNDNFDTLKTAQQIDNLNAAQDDIYMNDADSSESIKSESVNMTSDSVAVYSNAGKLGVGSDLTLANTSADEPVIGNTTTYVSVNNVTANYSGIVNIPFNITDSNGNPVSGGRALVTIYVGDTAISKFVEINDGVGVADFKISDLVELIEAKGLDISYIFNIIASTVNETNINRTQMREGLDDVYNSMSFDLYDLITGLNEIQNSFNVNVSSINEGLRDINGSFSINVSGIIDGYNDIIGAFTINISSIIPHLSNMSDIIADLSNISDDAASKLRDALNIIASGFEINLDGLSNITDSFSFNQSAVKDAIGDILNVSGIVYGIAYKIADIIEVLDLNFTDSQIDALENLSDSKKFNISAIALFVKDVLDTNNKTVSDLINAIGNVTDGFKLNVSDIIKSIDFNLTNVSDAISKIIDSVKINTTNILDSINSISISFNASKVIDGLFDVTGINATKIYNFIDAISDIMGGLTFNQSVISDGIKDISESFSLNASNAYVAALAILNEFSFNQTAAAAALGDIISEFDLRDTIQDTLLEVIDYLDVHLNLKQSFDLAKIFLSKELNLSAVADFVKNIMNTSNLNMKDIAAALSNVTNGFKINLSSIVDKIKDVNFNKSKVMTGFENLIKSVNFNDTRISDLLSDIANSASVNMSKAVSGFYKIFEGIGLNLSDIVSGLDKISLNFNMSDFSYLKDIFSVNTTAIRAGADKIADAFIINKTAISNGVKKISDAFFVNASSISDGLSKLTDSFTFNKSMAMNGLEKIVGGLKINVSDVISKLLASCQHNAKFAYLFAPGIYNISVIYGGSKVYAPSENFSAKLTVISNKPVSTAFENITVKNGNLKTVLVDSEGKAIANAPVSYKINGAEANATTDENGMILITVESNSLVEVNYLGGVESLPARMSINIENIVPLRSETTIKGNNFDQKAVDYYAGERGGYFRVQLFDKSGKALANKSVKIGFNAKVYNTTTDANGWAQLQINLAKAGTYTFAVGFLGDDDYLGAFEVYKITVTKKTTSISASDKSFKASAAKSYTVTLKTEKGASVDGKTYLGAGKIVKITVNGKTYSAKTNDKGQATFKLAISKKGTYNASIKYAGDNTYNSANKSVKITIN